MSDAWAPDVDWQPIAPQARTFWIIGAVVPLVLVLTVGVLVLTAVGAGSEAVALAAIGAVVTGLVVWTIGRRWRAWGYAERDTDLLIRRGVLIRKFTVVPYGRMQFVDVTQGPLDRWLGLATVTLHTAAAATDATIPLLRTDEAHHLRDRLVALGEARAAGL